MHVYQFINRQFEYINRTSPILFLTPYARNIGNCAEEIYYGLLKARRDGKRAVFLFPRQPIWKFRVEVANRELLEIESDYCLPNNSAWCHLSGWLLTVAFTFLRYSYFTWRRFLQILQRVWPSMRLDPRHNIFYVVPSMGRATLWQREAASRFSWDVVESCRWRDQYERYLPVGLRREKHQYAEKLRVEMGIPLDRWYVCLHVREAGFRNDAKLAAPRNSSILNYLEGIRAITNAGGFVVRLGDPSMTRLPPMPQVIDYAHTAFKSELMDLYLISQCRFYVGVNSGPLDITWLFQKHVVLTNLTEWTMSFPKQKGDLAIIKHIFSRSRNRFLSLKEILNEPFECQCAFIRGVGNDYAMVENTPEEIRDVIVEFLTKPQDYSYSGLQDALNDARRAQIHRWLDQEGVLFALNPLDDAVERYRLASRADSIAGTLGQKYLEQNWTKDCMNEGAFA